MMKEAKGHDRNQKAGGADKNITTLLHIYNIGFLRFNFICSHKFSF
jgi:hypothetical protein